MKCPSCDEYCVSYGTVKFGKNEEKDCFYCSSCGWVSESIESH